MTEAKKTQADYQATYHQKQLERGLLRVSVYVPGWRKKELVEIARKMVEDEDT